MTLANVFRYLQSTMIRKAAQQEHVGFLMRHLARRQKVRLELAKCQAFKGPLLPDMPALRLKAVTTHRIASPTGESIKAH